MNRAWACRSAVRHSCPRPGPSIAGLVSYKWCHVRAIHCSPRHDAEITPLRKQLKEANKAARRAKEQSSSQSEVSTTPSPWRLTVGIEIHAQLNTARKLFSNAPASNDIEPNGQIASFDVALPGSLPQLQKSTVIPAIRAAIALGSHVESISRFDRKHYFYHDQPAGYQITQYYQPFATGGTVTLNAEDGLAAQDGEQIVVNLKQIQLEQDTAKTQELEDGTNLIDFSRSGQPLIEIISMPQIHSPEAAAAYVKKVQSILQSIDAVTTGMELGGLRADVNVSVKHVDDMAPGSSYGGFEKLGQRTEIKNLSSFKAVSDAIKAERDRQIQVLESGGIVEAETRGWSITSPSETRRLRGKEGEVDYRYMPDPDLPPLYIQDDLVDHLSDHLPAVPDRLTEMLHASYGLSRADARSLVALENGDRLNYFQRVVHLADSEEKGTFGRVAANWVLHELGSLLATHEVSFSPKLVLDTHLAELIRLRENNKLTNVSAKHVLKMLFEGDRRPVRTICQEENLWFQPMTDEEYSSLAEQVLQAHPQVVDEVRAKGQQGKIQFLVGQMMRTGDRERIEAPRAETMLRARILGEEIIEAQTSRPIKVS